MELTLEHVAPAARDSFAARHRAWGSGVRIADLELAGIRSRGEHDLCVFVRIAWYRPEEQELRTTTVQQDWHDTGGWQLMAEQRVDGDVGLLGEAVAPPPVTDPRPASPHGGDLALAAARSLDPHQVKLVEACRRGLAATGDPAFAAAAETVTGLR